MLRTDRSEQGDEGAGGTALVPLTPTLHRVCKAMLPRPDPGFVTQLIANAEHVPQGEPAAPGVASGRQDGLWHETAAVERGGADPAGRLNQRDWVSGGADVVLTLPALLARAEAQGRAPASARPPDPVPAP